MANFTPAGTIHIGRVPFDNSYKHTIDCFTEASQASVMLGFCNRSLSRSDYTYVRMNNSIRVPYNAEDLYTYNYVMYQNANYGTKWFYAFITDIQYVNENMTELALELDVLQTWWFDWTREECFVEREHVNSDKIGEHTNPEPEMPFNLTSNDRFTDNDLREKYVIVQTNAVPHYIDEARQQPFGTDAVSGGWYQRVYGGSKYYAYTYDEATGGDDTLLNKFLDDLNTVGAAESISGMFTIPTMFVPNVGSDHGVQTETRATGEIKRTSMPASLDGYKPRNNKLFTYPYCFCRFTDNNGGCVELKYELWGKDPEGMVSYTVSGAIDPSAKAVVTPNVYAGVQRNYENALVFPVTAQCSWPFSSYQTWMAQNSLGNMLGIIANIALIAVPAGRGLNAAAKLGSAKAGLHAANVGKHSSKMTKEVNARKYDRAVKDYSNAMSGMGAISAGLGMSGLGGIAAEWSRQSNIPNVAKGQCSSNTMAQIGIQTYNIDKMSVTKEYAKIIDGFLDMYGYQVDMVKKPNMTGRASWNYVKCANSSNHGNVPAPDMAAINEILNAGLTIWHTTDVGNYSLDNSIV